MNSQVWYENETLKFASGSSYKFKFYISEIKEFENIVIVRLDIPAKSMHNENVYGISKNGELIWQIEPLEYIYENSPYTGMAEKHGKLFLFNWDGLEVNIAPETGRILNKKYGR